MNTRGMLIERGYNPPIPQADVSGLAASLALKADLASFNSVDVPFNAGDYTANGAMTWTVVAPDVIAFNYTKIGHFCLFNVVVVNSVLGGVANTDLMIRIPFTAVKSVATAAIAQDAPNFKVAIAQVAAGTNSILVRLAPIINWTLGVSEGVLFQITIETTI